MPRILFVRHGETNYNVLKLCNSSGPEVYLTPKGIDQAKELAINLQKESISQIYVSPTFRTRETLKYLKLDHISTNEDSRIGELRTNYEGRPIKEYMDLIGDSIKGKLKDGESVEDLYLRVNPFLKELSQYKDSTILVVTHSMIIKMIQVIVDKLPLESIDNISLPKNGEVYLVNLN